MARTASDVLAVVLLQRECGVREILRVVGVIVLAVCIRSCVW
jgi:phosphoenolpyruvate carboxylase